MTDAATHASDRPSEQAAPLGLRTEGVRARVASALGRDVDAAWLAGFRVVFGLTMCVSMLRFLAYGWIDDFFVTPRFHFHYWGFGWVTPLPLSGMHALFWALAGLALATALGLGNRVAPVLFLAGFTYVQLLDVTTYLNHYYLAAILVGLLVVAPSHRAYSLDGLLGLAKPLRTLPAAWLWLFRFQVGVVYTFAGLAKLNADWLLHAQPLRIWLASRTDLPLLGPLLHWEHAAIVMSWCGFLFDTFVAWFLLARRTRPFAYAVVIVFHVTTRVLFPIGMFPIIMCGAALVFFEPSWPRALFVRLTSFGRASSRGAPSLASPARGRLELAEPRPVRRGLVALAVVYGVLQIAVPLRFLAYGGNVRWHEQGMRWSWRVMVREKNASVTFVVKSKDSGRVWHVSPRRYLTPLQEREMQTQPDLILQLAHHVRDDFARQGLGEVEVRVDAIASLNGRRSSPLIDPDVDLASVSDGFGKARWILPCPTDVPPHLRPI